MSGHDGERPPRGGLGLAGLVLGAALLAVLAGPADAAQPQAWTQPRPPFRIVDGVYYVGTQGLAAYLVTSPGGDILLDGTLARNASLVEQNIRRLGVRLRDVKVLLVSHAHADHAGALARLKRDTGAKLYASAGDRWALEHGRGPAGDPNGVLAFPPVKVDRVLADGETIRVGGIAMTAWLTPGHTRGCTTWALPVVDRGRPLRVLFVCSLTVAGNPLVGNAAYPAIVGDFRRSFARLKGLRADVVLTAHPEFSDVMGRRRRQLSGDADAFIDPSALPEFVAAAEAAFDAELARQQAAAPRAG